MKLLLDANVSWRLSVKLKIHFDDCSLLRTGNQSNSYIGSLLIKHKENIRAFSGDAQTGLLEIF